MKKNQFTTKCFAELDEWINHLQSSCINDFSNTQSDGLKNSNMSNRLGGNLMSNSSPISVASKHLSDRPTLCKEGR